MQVLGYLLVTIPRKSNSLGFAPIPLPILPDHRSSASLVKIANPTPLPGPIGWLLREGSLGACMLINVSTGFRIWQVLETPAH